MRASGGPRTAAMQEAATATSGFGSKAERPGSAAPPILAWHVATSVFRRAMKIDAAKSVSFRNKKQSVLDLKLVHRKC